MNFSHYGAEPFQFDPFCIYKQGHHKPSGLWLSVDGEADWRAWCTREDWGLERLAWKTAITLALSASVLLIKSVPELDEFSLIYGKSYKYKDLEIYWPEVSSAYDGIIIAPYLWQRRLEVMWYYSWDCASGCIWNLAAINEVEESIKTATEKEQEFLD